VSLLLPINKVLPRDETSLSVRSVELSNQDSIQTYREKLAKIILDDMYQFVGLLNIDGTLLEVNRAALEGAGIKLADIQGKPFWEARWWQVSKETVERQKEVCARAAAGEFIRYDVEIYGQHGGDDTIIIDYSLFPVKDNSGRVVFLLAEGRNITEKKKADAEIARKNQELEQLLGRIRELDEIKSQFFANVSHELRTPLALISGPAEKILREADDLSAIHRRDIQVIKRNASTLLKHVNDLLDISKLDAGKMTVSYAAIDLSRLARMVAGHFDALAPERGIKYVIDMPQSLASEVDPDKIERVILNLLSNAFKFTPAGGRIKVSLRANEADRALLQVQDSGPGIKREDRESIFERFRQSDGGSTRKFGGTGLGLSIAKDFIELHRGSISVIDAPGGGALFQVEVPLKAPDGWHVRLTHEYEESEIGSITKGTIDELTPVLAQSAITKQHGSSPSNRPIVLVAEDNVELNRYIVENLAGEFEIVNVFDGEEGLAKASSIKPDLIVTDIMMPKMSGDQMVAAIRKVDELDNIPILVLSAKADDELRLKLLENGAQDYVTKPFSSQELLSRVRNLVAMKRAQEQLALANKKLQEQTQAKSAQLAQSENRFRLLVDSIQDYAIFMLNPEGEIASWNRGAERLTGYQEAEAIGRHISMLYTRPDQERSHVEYEFHMARLHGRYEEEGVRVRKDGTTYQAQVIVSRVEDEQGRHIGFAKITKDVTKQRAAEIALQESEAKFRSITDAMPQMVWSARADGYNDYFNQQWYAFTGVPEESMQGEGWAELIPSDDRERLWKVWRVCLVSGEPYELEHRFRHHSGEYRWVLARGLPVRDASGQIIRWMGTLTDIHEKKLSHEAVQAESRRKDEFLAMLAHELRNPLAPISTAAQILKMVDSDNKHVRQSSEIIARQVKHMASLVDDLLDVSRVTRGLITLEKEHIDIKSIVTSAIEQVRPLIESRGHMLTTRIAAQHTYVFGDRTRLTQVLVNLLNNAVKYTPPNGEIVLGVDVEDSNVRVCVKDNGTGIESDLLPHIFDLFTQGKRTLDRSQGGLGLGLALAKNMVHLHDGRIEAKSDGPGKGSAFTIFLPLSQNIQIPKTTGSTAVHPSANSCVRLMIVDDNADAAEMLATLLAAEGHHVTVKNDALSALEAASAVQPEVFILDIGLPDMDGYELARRLHARPETKDAIYIALTGYGQPQDVALSKQAGFDHHFVKPMDTSHLTDILKHV
jgi:PAS domain S-box-containing protein